MRLYLGVDTGINSTGLIAINEDAKVIFAENISVPKHYEYRKSKVDFVCEKFLDFVEMVGNQVCGCFLEDHALTSRRISKKSTSIFDINRLDGRFEQILWEHSIPFSYIRVDHIKWVVDCSTRSPKYMIWKRVKSQFGEDFTSFGDACDDMADAYILARLLLWTKDFKKNPREFVKQNEPIGNILRNYSAFFKFREIRE